MLRTRILAFILVGLGSMLVLGLANPEAVDGPTRTAVALGAGLVCALFLPVILRAWCAWDYLEPVVGILWDLLRRPFR